ncbi:hypothetical protein AX17_006299 [Amanita inopinata Kibby_2008]|nr:hypothetical protein AX17_006299 [Amanita inopinata Kibby_2008]
MYKTGFHYFNSSELDHSTFHWIWDLYDIPDLTGKVVIVTGANTGVGKEIVKALLLHNAKVYIASRNRERTERAILELEEQTGSEAHFIQCDLADLKSVKAAAEEFISKETKLHVLFNNAGMLSASIDDLTVQGYDLQLGTNTLGPFYLTKLLLPTLLATAKNSQCKVRVVNTSSIVHYIGSLDFNRFKDTRARRRCLTTLLYAQSKYADTVFAAELARRYGDQGIVSTAVNPGNLRTELGRNLPRFLEMFLHAFCYPASNGALTPLYAGTSPEGENFNGKYLMPWARLGNANPGSLDPKLGQQFWEWCEDQVKDI